MAPKRAIELAEDIYELYGPAVVIPSELFRIYDTREYIVNLLGGDRERVVEDRKWEQVMGAFLGSLRSDQIIVAQWVDADGLPERAELMARTKDGSIEIFFVPTDDDRVILLAHHVKQYRS
jgi:hypothetical protein